MKLSIKYKLLPVIIIGIVLVAAVFFVLALDLQKEHLDRMSLDSVQTAKKTFYNLVESDNKMLKAAMTDFMTNQEFKDVYLKNDRNQLAQLGKGLFEQHKAMGLTHFYFHQADGTTFLRLHNPKLFGDKVNRKTFAAAKTANSWGTGIELGKTAFALRVVHPYYNKDSLIGYIEYGEEIDHFLRLMKTISGRNYAILVENQLIDPVDWAAVSRATGAPSYFSIPNYVMVDSTSELTPEYQRQCLSESILKSVAPEGSVFNKILSGNRTLVCGGFPLLDAGGARLGVVMVTDDVTELEHQTSQYNTKILGIAAAAVLLISLILILLIHKIVIKPLTQIVDVTTRVAGGDFTATVDVKSSDEIGELAELISGLRMMIADATRTIQQYYGGDQDKS